MLLMSVGPLLGTLTLIAVVLSVGIIALIVTAEKQVAAEHDPERANQWLTMKLRAPWTYRVSRVRSLLLR